MRRPPASASSMISDSQHWSRPESLPPRAQRDVESDLLGEYMNICFVSSPRARVKARRVLHASRSGSRWPGCSIRISRSIWLTGAAARAGSPLLAPSECALEKYGKLQRTFALAGRSSAARIVWTRDQLGHLRHIARMNSFLHDMDAEVALGITMHHLQRSPTVASVFGLTQSPPIQCGN